MSMHACPKGHQSQAGDYCDECGTPIGGSKVTSVTGTPDLPPPGGACPDCNSPQAGRFCEVCGYDFVMAKIGGPRAKPAETSTPKAAITGSPVTGDSGASSPATSGTTTGDATDGGTDGTGGTDGAGSTAGAGEGATAGEDGAAGAVPGTDLPRRTSPVVGGPTGWALAVSADADYHARMQAQAEADAAPIPMPAFVPPRRFAVTGTQALIGRRSRSRGIEPEIDLSGPPADPAVSHAHALLLADPDGSLAVVDLESSNGTYVNDETDPIEPNVPRQLTSGDRVYLGAWTTITLTHSIA